MITTWRDFYLVCNEKQKRRTVIICEISGSHGGEYGDESLLGYNAV
jgi:hypothetical protein